MKNLYRLSAATFFLFVFSLNASAQKSFDCKKLLQQEIKNGASAELVDNVTRHADCFSLDSVDLRIYGDSTALARLLVNRNGALTYAGLLANINNAKKDTSYTTDRNLVLAQMKLNVLRFTPDNWTPNLKYLKILGMPDSEMEPFHQFVIEKQAHHWTYRQLITAYQMRKEASAPAKQ